MDKKKRYSIDRAYLGFCFTCSSQSRSWFGSTVLAGSWRYVNGSIIRSAINALVCISLSIISYPSMIFMQCWCFFLNASMTYKTVSSSFFFPRCMDFPWFDDQTGLLNSWAVHTFYSVWSYLSIPPYLPSSPWHPGRRDDTWPLPVELRPDWSRSSSSDTISLMKKDEDIEVVQHQFHHFEEGHVTPQFVSLV